MAASQHKRLERGTLSADRDAVVALRTLPNYAPANPAISVEAISALEERLRQAEAAELLARRALDAARDATEAAGWELHNAMLGVKAAVIGQYGASSDEIQALGLKKKSDYRRPARRAPKA